MGTSMHHFHTLKVAGLQRETEDAVSIEFAVPAELAEEFRYKQGQHLTLRRLFDGEDVRRNYSICSGVAENRLRVAIKRIEGGLFSSWAANELQLGDELEVMAPAGHFYTDLEASNAKHYVGIAAGSGITPIISNLKTVLESESQSRFTLVYSNRNTQSVIFLEELEDLKNAYPERLNLVYLFSRELQDVELFSGRIDREKLDALLDGLIPAASIDECFICGPEEMLNAAREALAERGVAKENVHFELFVTAAASRDAAAARDARHLSEEEAGHMSEVAVVLDGKQSLLKLRRGDESILDAALKTRSELPFACKGGVCCTCRAMVVEGEVEMDVNYGLEPDEIEAGYVLTCQAHPVSDRVVVDFDR